MTPEIVAAVISKFGTQTRLAEAIDRDQSTIAHWKRRGVIPAREQGRILQAAEKLGIDLTPVDFFKVRAAACDSASKAASPQ